MYKVAIVGCGELGSRFLQSLSTSHLINEVNVIEPNESSRMTALARFNQVEERNLNIRLNFFQSIDSSNMCVDLCIIATQADDREKLIKKIISCGVKKIITEKIVTQSLSSYKECLENAHSNQVNIWVNCKTRAYSSWKYIKSNINSKFPISYLSTGGNHGICTNGIHSLDLFVFLTGTKCLEVQRESFDLILHKTKRGKYDISGMLSVSAEVHHDFTISYSKSNLTNPIDVIYTPNSRWIVDNSNNTLIEALASEGWVNKFKKFDENVSVSVISKFFIEDILQNNTCDLPTLEESYLSHKLIFESTLPLFNTLLKKDDDICPIT